MRCPVMGRMPEGVSVSGQSATRVTVLNVLLVVLLGVTAWQQYQLRELGGMLSEHRDKQAADMARLDQIVTPFETMRAPGHAPLQSGKTPSELHRPRGPKPVSILVESDRRPEDPPPGSDVTSTIRKKKVDPCEGPCYRLGQCVLQPDLCPTLDTRQHDRITEACMTRCGADEAVRESLSGVTDCGEGVRRARKALPGFSALCGSR